MAFPRLRDSSSGRRASSRNLGNTFLRDSVYRVRAGVIETAVVAQKELKSDGSNAFGTSPTMWSTI